MPEATMARRVHLLVAFLLSVSVVVSLTVGLGAQEFAAFGLAKRITLPLAYVLVVLALFRRHSGERVDAAGTGASPRMRVPAWAWLPTVGIAFGLLGSGWLPDEHAGTSDLLQGMALFVGFTLLAVLGLRSRPWSLLDERRMVWLLVLAGLAAGLLGRLGFTPFLALTVPACFGALLLGLRVPGRRGLTLLLAGILGVLMVRALTFDPNVPPSAASLAEVAICVFLLVVSLLPRFARTAVLSVGAVFAVLLFWSHGGPDLVTGRTFSTDPTIAQRSFEAQAVLAKLDESTWAELFGYGPGGTVNLSASPDAATLAASGRDLLGVDDVHLLSAYLLLKLGLLGILWLIMLVVALGRTAIQVMRDGEPYRMVLFLFVAAGFVNALPAATNLLVNPLVPLLLGVLSVPQVGSTSRPRRTLPRSKFGSRAV